MKKTELEEVTRTYCDMCGRDMTHAQTRHGRTLPSGRQIDICDYFPGTDYKFRWQMPQHMRTMESCLEAADRTIAEDSGDRWLG